MGNTSRDRQSRECSLLRQRSAKRLPPSGQEQGMQKADANTQVIRYRGNWQTSASTRASSVRRSRGAGLVFHFLETEHLVTEEATQNLAASSYSSSYYMRTQGHRSVVAHTFSIFTLHRRLLMDIWMSDAAAKCQGKRRDLENKSLK